MMTGWAMRTLLRVMAGALAVSLVAGPGHAGPRSAADRRALGGVASDTALGRELSTVLDAAGDPPWNGRHFVLAQVLDIVPDEHGEPVSEVEFLDVRVEAEPEVMNERVSSAPLFPLLGVFAFFVPLKAEVETGLDLDVGDVRLVPGRVRDRVRGLLPRGKIVGLWVQRDSSGLLRPMISVDPGWIQTPRELDVALVPRRFRTPSIRNLTQSLVFPNDPGQRVAAWRRAIKSWEARGGTAPEAARTALLVAEAENAGESPPASVYERAADQLASHLSRGTGVPGLDLLSLARMQAHLERHDQATSTYMLARAELPPHPLIDQEIAGAAVRAERWDAAATTLELPLARGLLPARGLCERMRESAPEATADLCPAEAPQPEEPAVSGSEPGLREEMLELFDAEAPEEEIDPESLRGVVAEGHPVVFEAEDGVLRRAQISLTREYVLRLRVEVTSGEPLYGRALRVFLNPKGASWIRVGMREDPADATRHLGIVELQPDQAGPAYVYAEVLDSGRAPRLDGFGSDKEPLPLQIGLPR